MSQGYWNRAPVPFRLVRAVVGRPPEKQVSAWYRPLVGTTRTAVEVTTAAGKLIYIDNEDGSGLAAVQAAPGQPVPGHRVFPAAGLVEAADTAPALPTEGRVIPQPLTGDGMADPATVLAGERMALDPAYMTSASTSGSGALDSALAEVEKWKARAAAAEAALGETAMVTEAEPPPKKASAAKG